LPDPVVPAINMWGPSSTRSISTGPPAPMPIGKRRSDAPDRRHQPIDRRAHVGQEKRIVELTEVG
jgi:hypothetical protein